MANNKITPGAPYQERIYKQTVLTLAGDYDVFKGPCVLYSITVVNGSGEVAYIKLYDAVKAAATDQPDLFFRVVNGDTRTMSIPVGLTFKTALTIRVSDAVVGASDDGALPSGSAVQVYLHAKEL